MEKELDYYIDSNGQKIAHIYDKEGNKIDTEKAEPHAWMKRRKCEMCDGILELQPVGVSYALRGDKIFFAETRPEKEWKFTLLNTSPNQVSWILACNKCVFARNTTYP